MAGYDATETAHRVIVNLRLAGRQMDRCAGKLHSLEQYRIELPIFLEHNLGSCRVVDGACAASRGRDAYACKVIRQPGPLGSDDYAHG